MGRFRSSARKQALAALMLLAALVRAAIPAGYMLAPATDGSSLLAITLCTGYGEAEAVLDLATGEVFSPDEAPIHGGGSSDDTQHDLTPCAFATTAAAVTAPSPPTVFIAFRQEAAGFVRPASLMPGHGLVAPPPWATGPPTLA
jgi:hypothetical protein